MGARRGQTKGASRRRPYTGTIYRAPTSRGQGGDDVAGDGFATANSVYAFVGLGFEVDFFGRNAERLREGFAHFGKVWAELGSLENHNDIDVLDSQSVLIEELARVLQKEQAVGALPLGIGVGEMLADVAESRGAKESVAEGVGDHITIRMANRPLVEGHVYAADDELATIGKAVKVVADAAANAHDFFCSECR